MAHGSQTRNGMIGRCGKPFCGDCCGQYRQGSGSRRKVSKRIARRREKRRWRREEIQT